MSEIFDLTQEFNQDKRKDKINGTIGVIVTDDGRPYVMPCVKEALKDLRFDNFNYLPIAGDEGYCQVVKKLLLLSDHRIQGTVGGTNALYLWSQLIGIDWLIIRKNSWENHYNIFKSMKLLEWNTFEGLKKILETYESETPILYQIVDNPTGDYFTKEQWQKLAQFKNPVLFDLAYQGLGKGLVEDLYPLKLFPDADVAISFSKIMTLYQHRVGALLTRRDWDMEGMFRKINSNPPAFGELIVTEVLKNHYLNWREQLDKMRLMIDRRREVFGIKGNGLYSLLLLNKKQIDRLKKEHGIYLLSNGRVNFGGVTKKQAEIVAKVI